MSTKFNAEDGCVFAGENVVRGDKESINNLLEIFDGLLEYLKEEISEESQNGGRQINVSLFSHQLYRYAFYIIGYLWRYRFWTGGLHTLSMFHVTNWHIIIFNHII